MHLRSPALAIGWEIWRRNRIGMFVSLAIVLFAGALNGLCFRNSPWLEFARQAGYLPLVLALFVTFGCFHYTEGHRKGGFGSFPPRLFHLPVATGWLVALPMIYGFIAVLLVYLAGAGLIFGPMGVSLPLLWPCLYLASGFALFQMIIWSFPERPYLKLLCLSVAATVLAFGWMFFLPDLIQGSLEVWGYTGSPALFQRYLLIGLALTVPAAFAIGFHRVRQQRHGLAGGKRRPPVIVERFANTFFHRHKPFLTPGQATFWHEWRQTGFILPFAVAAILAMTCLPSWLSSPLNERATLGILSWIFISPLLLAGIIGRGFSKPDFWNQELNVAPFHAVRPLPPGEWVLAKLKVAVWSVVLTWGLVLYVSFLWLSHAGDLGAPNRLFQLLKFHYGPQERWLIIAWAFLALLLLTWRFMVSGLAVGLSGRKRCYQSSNGVIAFLLMAIFALWIWRSDHADHRLHLFNLWNGITWLPIIAGVAVIAKATLAAWAWHRVHHNAMLQKRTIHAYFGGWALGTAILAGGVLIAFPHAVWLRNLLILFSFLIFPLAGPGLAILTLAKNRSGG